MLLNIEVKIIFFQYLCYVLDWLPVLQIYLLTFYSTSNGYCLTSLGFCFTALEYNRTSLE